MKIQRYKEFKKLTDLEVKEQTENIFNFLKETHCLLEEREETSKILIKRQLGAGNLALELRALKRDGGTPVYKNLRLYKFNDSEKQRLYGFLKDLNNKGIPYCLFYSVFAFSDEILAVSQSGNTAEKWNNRIALNNAIATKILIMDFDNISEDEFSMERLKLAKLGIETIDIFSGHGFQSIILLDEICWDLDILRKFTNLLLSKGFKVDSKIKDAARIMRLPYTFNSKEFGKKAIENPEIIKTYIYAKASKRHNLEEVFRSLESMETVVEIPIVEELKIPKKIIKNKVGEVEHLPIEIENVAKKTQLEVIREKDNLNNLGYDIKILKELYPMLDIDELPGPVKNMLMGFRRGYANSMLMFLTLYLKEQGYAKSTIQEAMLILGEQDRYNYPWEPEVVGPETSRFFYNKEYSSKGIFFKELQQFGYIEYKLIDKSVLTINNYVFNNLDKISSSAFYIYIKLLLEQDMTGTSVFTIDEMSEVVGYKRRTILKHLDDLVSAGLIDRKRANRRNKEEYKYFLSVFMVDNLGFTKISKGSIKLLLNMVDFGQINQTQLSICMYFKYICYGNKTESNISQESLAKALGMKQSSISKSFKELEETKLIYREKEGLINDFRFKYNYSIHF